MALTALAVLAVPRAGAQESRITAALIARHVGVLADDSMRGRFTPSPEIELAAHYVEAAFRSAGLRPAGDSSYAQRYPVRSRDTSLHATAPNVVGLLPGGDPRRRGQVILVVAHLDHVGVRQPVNGDSVYNGADDNASGTAGLLALADALGGLSARPARSILFLSVSGEERGLWGSIWYAAHPTVPFDSIVALVNLDMIGRNRPDSVFLNGWGKSTISDLVRRLAEAHRELGLSVGPDVEDRPVTPADSDHWPFQRRGVPYIFFYTGEHPDYHRPGDEPAKLDADKAARIARLAFLTVLQLCNAAEVPAWTPESRRLNVTSP
jgi:Zn-dependent M28 family amino/carboxypeptidase